MYKISMNDISLYSLIYTIQHICISEILILKIFLFDVLISENLDKYIV